MNNVLIGAQVFCWPKIINPLGHKTILGPSAQGWFCVLRWNKLEQLELELEKIIGFKNTEEKLFRKLGCSQNGICIKIEIFSFNFLLERMHSTSH